MCYHLNPSDNNNLVLIYSVCLLGIFSPFYKHYNRFYFKSNLRFTEEFCRQYRNFTCFPYSLSTLPPSNSLCWCGMPVIIDKLTSTGLHPPPVHSYSPPKSLATIDLFSVSIVFPFSTCHIVEIK